MRVGTVSRNLALVLPFLAAACFAQAPTPTPIFPLLNKAADINGDGVVGEDDLLQLEESWHTGGRFEGAKVNVGIPGLPETARSMTFVRIPAAGHSFQMGSPDNERGRGTDEGPAHTVTFNYNYYLTECEITQAQWTTLMGSNPPAEAGFDNGIGDDYPVYWVSWNAITRAGEGFLDKMNLLGHGRFRLPSEAEWEYACRAGSSTRFYFGNSLGCADDCENCEAVDKPINTKGFDPGGILPIVHFRIEYMWYCGNSLLKAEPVATKTPNAFGLYDMHGNVEELCQDTYQDSYSGAPTNGSAWEIGGTTFDLKVARGGARNSAAGACRSAHRDVFGADVSGNFIGFRLARTE